jgi:hypothetical protein
MLKVGRDVVIDKKSGKERKAQYRDVEYDPGGWTDAAKYLPYDYDLVLVKTKGKKTTGAWSYGSHWDGRKIDNSDEILYWKREGV